jgi:putative transposase
MRRYQLGAHTKTDLKVHLIWLPKYRKRVLIGPVAIRTRDVLRQISLERPMQDVSKIVQWLKGISSRILLSEFPHLKKQFWGRHIWVRGYLAVSSGNITDELIQQYIQEQEGEPVTDDSRFEIDPS